MRHAESASYDRHAAVRRLRTIARSRTHCRRSRLMEAVGGPGRGAIVWQPGS